MRLAIRTGVLAAAASLFLAAPALAEPAPTEADKAAAQALFDVARKLTAEKRFTEACPKLEESQRLDPSLGTEYYLADCFEQIGRLAAAQIHFIEVAAKARAAGQIDRAEFARRRADALAPRIPRLVVELAPAAKASPGLTVTRDGAKVSEAQLGVPILVELGKHTVVATSASGGRWENTVEIGKEGETITVLVQAPAAAIAAAPTPAVEPPPARMSPVRIGGFVVGGAGVIGLAVGAAFGAVAMSKNAASKADGHCDADSFCDATGKAARQEAITSAKVSTAAFVTGGVMLAGGLVMVIAGKPASPPRAAVDLGPGRIALTGRF